MSTDATLLCPDWRSGDFSPRAVPVQGRSTEEESASRDEIALSAPMERLVAKGYVRFTARQLGALRHPNLGEGAA